MAEKVKILKKDIQFLKKDVELEKDVVEKLAKLQEQHQKKFQDRIEAGRKEALERYTARIKDLEEAKAQAVKQFDDGIEKYQEFVKNLKEQTKEVKPKPKKGKGRKTKK